MNAKKQEQEEKKKGWPWWVKLLLVAFLIAFVGAYAAAQLKLGEQRAEIVKWTAAAGVADGTVTDLLAANGALLEQRASDSLTIAEVVTVLETVNARRVVALNLPPVVDTQFVDRPVEAPPCVVCRAVADTQFVDRIVVQIDTVVHTVEVVQVVAKRRWWEFVIVAGISGGIGYVIGDGGESESSSQDDDDWKERGDH